MSIKDIYKINIVGREESLPIITLPSKIRIAFFNLHGNPLLTEFCGKKIAEMLRDKGIEALITAESKGLQLTHVVARELGLDFYAVARKGKKIYMDEYCETVVKAVTGETEQKLYLSRCEMDKLNGKRVAIVDDVISSGGSLAGLKDIVLQSGGEVVAIACVLAEGESIGKREVMRLADLPLL